MRKSTCIFAEIAEEIVALPVLRFFAPRDEPVIYGWISTTYGWRTTAEKKLHCILRINTSVFSLIKVSLLRFLFSLPRSPDSSAEDASEFPAFCASFLSPWIRKTLRRGVSPRLLPRSNRVKICSINKENPAGKMGDAAWISRIPTDPGVRDVRINSLCLSDLTSRVILFILRSFRFFFHFLRRWWSEPRAPLSDSHLPHSRCFKLRNSRSHFNEHYRALLSRSC